MIRRRPRNGNAGALTVPLAMVDTWLLLVGITVIEAVFGVAKISLPKLPGIERTEAVADGRQSLAITVLVTGDVLFNGDPITVADIPERIRGQADPARVIEINVETGDDGQGNFKVFGQLVNTLEKAGIETPLLLPVQELSDSE